MHATFVPIGPRRIEPGTISRAIEHREGMRAAVLTAPPGRLGPSWRFLGPSNLNGKQPGGWAISGRVNAVAFDPKNSSTWYLGAPYGGVWKTTDSGTTWIPLTDAWRYLSVTSIAIDPKDTGTIYVGTGDVPGAGPYAMGIMKSTDGGTPGRPSGRRPSAQAPYRG
jgi:hypothetical protein